jgi:hypothetical protein
MFRRTVLVYAVLHICALAMIAADENAPKGATAKGAKALFGESRGEIFFPREAGGSEVAMEPTNRVGEETLTDLYKTPEFPGIAYSIEVLRRGENSIVTVDDPQSFDFKTGDRLRLRLVPNFSGFAYVREVEGEHIEMVYPSHPSYTGDREHYIEAGRDCFVPTSGWLKLVDPAVPFSMRVLFKTARPESESVQLAEGAGSLSETVNREWVAVSGHKGIVFERDRSYVDTGSVPGQGLTPAIHRESYTTSYAVQVEEQDRQPMIAIEVPIQHRP